MRRRHAVAFVGVLAACGGGEGDDPDADTGPPDATPGCAERSEGDRPDAVSGRQVHVVYVIPADGEDRHLDTDGTIQTSVAAADAWFTSIAAGQSMRFDRYDDCYDVTFFRMERTNAQVEAQGPYVRNIIELELETMQKLDDDKLYAAYYDGASNYACGGGAWPPQLLGTVGALYLRGVIDETIHCEDTPITTSPAVAGYWEHAMLHELIHTLGFVPTCAPNETLTGHASDGPTDLMYSGPEPWSPDTLDNGNDDYYLANNCLDLSRSVFLEPPGTEEPPRDP
jgi:hypothetical protein